MLRRNQNIDRHGRLLAPGQRGAGPIVYWMSRDQRQADNWALLRAQQEALDSQTGLVVVFCLVSDYPGANLRHYLFMLKGLAELQQSLLQKNIPLAVLHGPPPEQLPGFLRTLDARALICDFDPLRIKRKWQKQLLALLQLPIYEVDSHNIIPAWIVSSKKEYGAYTIRPKIHRLLSSYLTEFPPLLKHPFPASCHPQPIDPNGLIKHIKNSKADEVRWLSPGEQAARSWLDQVLKTRLLGYNAKRNDPCEQGQSELSPYLHFGQLAPQRVALTVQKAQISDEDKNCFLEELIVRRELADNFCLYETNYDNLSGFPDWAQRTLSDHRHDRRPYCYSTEQFANGSTHSKLWNSCQQELKHRGKLHGYLRMYWAKKILEWSEEPEEALAIAIELNDRYALDGRDPNGYTGIAWSIGGVHDRAWKERPVFGKIRYMNENGCRRKFDVERFVTNVWMTGSG